MCTKGGIVSYENSREVLRIPQTSHFAKLGKAFCFQSYIEELRCTVELLLHAIPYTTYVQYTVLYST
jgi:hypothetical protein